MNSVPSTSYAKAPNAPTGAMPKDPIGGYGEDSFDPTPLTAGFVKKYGCQYNFTFIINIVLHGLALGLVLATAISVNGDADGNSENKVTGRKIDSVTNWCIFMIVFQLLGFFTYVGAFGFMYFEYVQSHPWFQIGGGGCFLTAFVSTLKLTYFLQIDKVYDPAETQDDRNHQSLAQATLIIQCFVIASIFFTQQVGNSYIIKKKVILSSK